MATSIEAPGRLEARGGAWNSIEAAQYSDDCVNLQAPVHRAPETDVLSDILSGMFSDISSHIPSDISSAILF